MANGDIIKLGTLYIDEQKILKASRPWAEGYTPPGSTEQGNLIKYVKGSKIEIRDTDIEDAYKIQWIEVNYGGKKLLISDRCLVASIAWNDLVSQSLITGKIITIDGQNYKVRILTGGNSPRNSELNCYLGGNPTTNEWDRIIANETRLSSLPIPISSDLDKTLNASDLNGIHNNLWHWYGITSFVQEQYSSGARICRGNVSAKLWGIRSDSVNGHYSIGWRPVLEVLNSSPTISGSNSDLGDKNKDFNIQYTINDVNPSDILIIREKLDGVVINTIPNAERNKEYTISIDIIPLSEGEHSIEIEVQDGMGDIAISNASKRVYTFTRPKLKKFFIKQDNKFYSINSENYNIETKRFDELIFEGSVPNKLEIINLGFNNVSDLTNYIKVTEDNFRPIDLLGDSFEIKLYKE